MPEPGFTLGDHRFLHPSEAGPLSRLDEPPRQIRGATPPSYLAGKAREATDRSPAATALLRGEFCGHGEPTMTVFDVVIDGEETLEIGLILDPDDADFEPNFPAVAVRKPDADEWFPVFKREWEDEQATLEPFKSAALSPDEAARIDPDTRLGRVAIGFEYPCDADSADCVSWLTVDVLTDDMDQPQCLVNAELA